MSTESPLLHRAARRVPGLINDLLKIAVVLAFVFPFYWMFATSVKPYAETIAFPPTLWPKHFTLESYRSSLTKLNILTYLRNSVVITLSVVVLQVIVMVPAAYAFARYKFFGKGLLFGLVLVAFMIPGQITFITTYIQMAKWKLLLTLLPQILPFGANAFGIFLLRQAFMQVPDEIIESARLDNAGELRTMTRIMLPMCKSTLSTVVMFSIVSHWNSYFWPLVMTDAESVRPLTIAIERLRDVEYGINWSSIMAGNALLVIPIIIMFVLARKRVIEGFAYKGVK